MAPGSAVIARKNRYLGSSFESWLDEEGIREEVAAAAIKAVIARDKGFWPFLNSVQLSVVADLKRRRPNPGKVVICRRKQVFVTILLRR